MKMGAEIMSATEMEQGFERFRALFSAEQLADIARAGAMVVLNQARENLATFPSKARNRSGEVITLAGDLERSLTISGEAPGIDVTKIS